MAAEVVGIYSVEADRDNDAHRTYKVRWLVEIDDPLTEGPEVVSGASGLAPIGAGWVIGADNDPQAICRPTMKITPQTPGEIGLYWWVDQTFTSKPTSSKDKNKQDNPDNPLLWLPEVSGGYNKFTREATQDNATPPKPLLSTSFERFKGSAVERDEGRPFVRIKTRQATLPLAYFATIMDTVNTSAMWGLSARQLKFSEFSWTKNWYGSNWTSFYYELDYGFEVNFATWDFKILNEGTKVLKPDGDVNKPDDYVPYLLKGQPSAVLLKTDGTAVTNESQINYKVFQVYGESNLLSVPGIPVTL